jgi:hypothetical protein
MRATGHAPVAWMYDAEPEIDFCVWILLADGLRVPPFEAHSEGSGELRSLGMDAVDWRDWLGRVVGACAARSRHMGAVGAMADPERMTANDYATVAGLHEHAQPAIAWNGSDAVRGRLRALWTSFGPGSDAWRRQVADLGGPVRLTSRDRGRLWHTVDRERTSGGTLRTAFVRYPEPVVAVVEPDTLIVALGRRPSVDGCLRLLRTGIARLEGREGPRERPNERPAAPP